jgi:hypothetical protein
MASRAQEELQEWDGEIEKGHGGHTHFVNGQVAC